MENVISFATSLNSYKHSQSGIIEISDVKSKYIGTAALQKQINLIIQHF